MNNIKNYKSNKIKKNLSMTKGDDGITLEKKVFSPEDGSELDPIQETISIRDILTEKRRTISHIMKLHDSIDEFTEKLENIQDIIDDFELE